jgi:molybdopterin-guanine dinucleotide biosynthesis protein A
MITGVLLAGGQGRRMGGVNKGLQPFRGKPLVEWTLERLAPQVNEVLINSNQNHDNYNRYGHRVIADSIEGFAGPLAGLQCALAAAKYDRVVTVPCDSPFLPQDLVRRLAHAVEMQTAQVGVAVTGAQPHPVFLYCHRDLLPNLNEYLAAGGRKIDAWYAKLRVVEIHFDDQPDSFLNINTLDELRS